MAYNNQTYNNRQSYSRGSYNQPVPQPLPDGYLNGGYYTTIQGEKVLKPEYITTYPKKIADSLSHPDESKKGKANKRSQLRKFYDYTLRINDLLNRKSGNFAFVESELDRLVPYVTYARSRETVSELFKMFIEKNINTIQDKDDLRAFVKHFEALIAYLPKEKN